jgi:hypothetical protein
MPQRLMSLGFVVCSIVLAPTIATADQKQIVIPWSVRINTATVENGIRQLRIDAGDSVSLKVTHFNFLHYSLKFTIEERTIESYVLLDQLWSQVFKAAGPLTEQAAATPTFEDAIVIWRKSLAGTDDRLATFMQKFAGKVALTSDECSEIGGQKKPLGEAPMATLESLRRDALDLAATSPQFDLYERVLAQHKAVIARLDAFVKAADLVVNGQVYPVGKKKAGTVVTFTIAPVDAKNTRAGEPFESSYFVQSTRPLMLHVGYAASRLKDVEFDRVRSASGSDLFLSTKSDATTKSLVTFMTYEFWRWGSTDDVGLGATLGTGFQKPGQSLFVSGAVRVNRFVLSVGRSGTGVKEGTGSVLETIAGAAGQRELFTTVTSKQKWARFAALSIRVF